MIYLDNSATTFPKPESVIMSVVNAQKLLGANPGRGGHQSTIKAGETVYKAREALAGMFSCESDGVVFTMNCTMSLNTAIKGIAEKGDHFIISSLEHNSVLRPIEYLREKGIITYDVAFVNPRNEEETVRNFSSLIRKGKTKAIVCTYASNVFGTVPPIKRLGSLCREKGIVFVVDAAQAAGTIPIDMKKANIDILCMPGHKSLFGPMGTGVMLLSGRIIPESFVQGGTGSFSMSKGQPDVIPDKYESGTANFPGIAGLLAGVNFIKKYGGEMEIHKKESELIKILREDLSVIKDAVLYDEMRSEICSPVLPFNISGLHSEEVGDSLDKGGFAVRAGYHCAYLAHNNYGTAEKGIVRVSPGIFNSKKDVKNLVFYLNKIAKRKKV